jgi:2-polyprenyl-6-methoxyphenol hydroxylase-like FAD-dependent oxidoreductase
MQYHLDGFRPGDPRRRPAPARRTREGLDVLIVGAGPAGLTLAAQLSRFPDLSVRLVERKDGPLQLGQADGVACRSMEMFEAFGFAEQVAREAYHVNEVSFWKPDPGQPQRIVRASRVQDVEDGLSEFPHVILSQARIHDFYLDLMRQAPAPIEPEYSTQFLGFERDGSRVRARIARGGETQIVETRYLVGCDGARSEVRTAMGYALSGDSANQAWGVMDVLAVTDFPDVRLKAAIQSANEGSALIIPREGGYLFRIYIELDKLGQSARVSSLNLSADKLVAAAQRILSPYTLDVKEIVWWSAYEIGQRLTDAFDDATPERDPGVFIAGDACHTHSPKAGQGMNVSMGDAFNLGWKLAAVLRGQARPELLRSYSQERHDVAQALIDFDREWAAMFSARPKEPGADGGVDPQEFQRYFVKHLRFTAGVETHYQPSAICGPATHQALATGFSVGFRFHSAPVVRLADAKAVHLGHCVEADGRWRLFLFADRSGIGLAALCERLAALLKRHTPQGADIDSVIDVRAIFQTPHREVALEATPALLRPRKGRLGLIDYEKIFCPDFRAGDIFEARAVARDGCVVVVRPDQYVAHVLPLDGFEALSEFFGGFLKAASGA